MRPGFNLHLPLRFGRASLAPTPSAHIYFQDGFESGVFVPPWDSVWDNHGGSGVTIASSPVHSGAKSAQFWYQRAAASGDDDEAIYTYSVTNLTHIFVRGYARFKTPEVGGNKNDIQRKLFFVSSLGPSVWQSYLTSDAASDVITPRISSGYQTVYSSQTLGWDTWYCLELEVLANTPGTADGTARLWIDGNLRAESTAFKFRDTGQTGALEYLAVGFAADNGGSGPAINEYRYWDDIVISDSYIGV